MSLLSVWIEPYAATSWGNWGAIKKCRGSNYVVGVQQRIEAPINGDDTALNAIRFTCSDGEVLISAEQYWGGWWSKKSTPSNTYFTGIQLRSESNQGKNNSMLN